MTTRRTFLSGMAMTGLAAQPVFRERAIASLFRANVMAGDRSVTVLTPLDNRQSGAIALVNVAGLDTVKLVEWLLSRHRIVSTPIVHPEFNGVRVTPNVYTTIDEIDVFADKMLDAIKRGVA